MNCFKNFFKTSQESETRQKGYHCQLLIPAIMNLAESISSLVIGVHYSAEDKDGNATLFLKVAGGILLCFATMKIVAFLMPCVPNEKVTKKLANFLDLSLTHNSKSDLPLGTKVQHENLKACFREL